MKKFFTTDIPTKILSLAIAVFLWVYLVVLLNPQIETTVSNIPITYSDHSNLAKNGYVITSETVENVSLKLRGSRNMLSNVSKYNISAYIDLSGCSEAGTYSLPIHVRLPYDELSIIDKSPYNVSIVVDKVIKQNFDLEIITKGSAKDGVHIDDIESSVDSVTITGPSEVVKSVDKVVSYIDINGIDNEKSVSEKIIMLNSRGEVIKNDLLSADVSEVDITCSVLLEKTVPVTMENVKIAPGYVIHSVNPLQITITGKKEVLETISSLRTQEYTFTAENTDPAEIDIILPNGVTAKDKSVNVVIKKEKEEESQANKNENNN